MAGQDTMSALKGGKKNKKDKKEEDKKIVAKLQCLEIDLTNPLTDTEWRNMKQVVDEVTGLGWFQILPVNQKASTQCQFNMLHVIPEDKLPCK